MKIKLFSLLNPKPDMSIQNKTVNDPLNLVTDKVLTQEQIFSYEHALSDNACSPSPDGYASYHGYSSSENYYRNH